MGFYQGIACLSGGSLYPAACSMCLNSLSKASYFLQQKSILAKISFFHFANVHYSIWSAFSWFPQQLYIHTLLRSAISGRSVGAYFLFSKYLSKITRSFADKLQWWIGLIISATQSSFNGVNFLFSSSSYSDVCLMILQVSSGWIIWNL